MIALPMPVASSTQPSSTKIGTDTRTMLDMPSSMRPTTTMQRHLRREGQVAHRTDAEAEGDRHAGGQAHRDEADQEDQDVQQAQLRAAAATASQHERGTARPPAPRPRAGAASTPCAPRRPARSPASRRCRRQSPRRERCSGCPASACATNHSSCAYSKAGCDQRDQEGGDRHQREGMHEVARARRQHVEEQRQPQMLVAVHRDGGADHRDPDEGDRHRFVDPDDRVARRRSATPRRPAAAAMASSSIALIPSSGRHQFLAGRSAGCGARYIVKLSIAKYGVLLQLDGPVCAGPLQRGRQYLDHRAHFARLTPSVVRPSRMARANSRN